MYIDSTDLVVDFEERLVSVVSLQLHNYYNPRTVSTSLKITRHLCVLLGAEPSQRSRMAEFCVYRTMYPCP